MHDRYAKKRITQIWSDENKLRLWQRTELALLEAMVIMKIISKSAWQEIAKRWEKHPPNIKYWKNKDAEIHHDLNAFLSERLRFLPKWLRVFVHRYITSFDTEESAFIRMILESALVVYEEWAKMEIILIERAKKHRFVIMNERTHGQEAELQSDGKRILTWIQDLRLDMDNLQLALKRLLYSKLSGAIGNYGSIDPKLEKQTLKLLGFKPYYGATQIMPREIYAPVAQALCQIVLTLDKIATTIRLGARSGRPIYQEPFKKKQKGSSAMPHKRNTIRTEQIEGMARMAKAYLIMIMDNIKTWEARAIEQSCVERVAWPDLFHVVVHSMEVMSGIFGGMKTYPDNMLLEIYESRGCYASAEVKEFLKDLGISYGLDPEEAYRIVQLAAFNAFDPCQEYQAIRDTIPKSLKEADELLLKFKGIPRPAIISIEELLAESKLYVMPDDLEADETTVARWNEILRKIFSNQKNMKEWHKHFQPSYLLRNETKLYREILGIN